MANQTLANPVDNNVTSGVHSTVPSSSCNQPNQPALSHPVRSPVRNNDKRQVNRRDSNSSGRQEGVQTRDHILDKSLYSKSRDNIPRNRNSETGKRPFSVRSVSPGYSSIEDNDILIVGAQSYDQMSSDQIDSLQL